MNRLLRWCLLFGGAFGRGDKSDGLSERFLVDGNIINVSVDSNDSIHTVSDKYLSVTMDTFEIHVHLRDFPSSSPKFRNIAKGLAPAYFRIGGSYADNLYFRSGPHGSVIMSEAQFDNIITFAHDVGWEVVFDLNLLTRKNNVWDSTNAESLLKYAASKNYSVNFEMGNEPALYFRQNKSVDPVQVGRDYVKLRHLMDSIPLFKDRLLVGPAMIASFKLDWAHKFLSTGSTAIDALTVHHYYMGGHNAVEKDFLSFHAMDSLRATIDRAREAMQKYSNGSKRVWLAETSSKSQGGTVLLSESFIAGFLWLDKLGLSAVRGVEMVARQSLVGGHYALLHQGDPLPDYWLSLVFKRLVGRKVLNVTSSDKYNRFIRIYAHCSQEHSKGVTFFFQNILSSEIKLMISQYSHQSYQLYLLTAGGDGSLTSRTVKLNGHELHMNGNELPPLPPVSGSTWPVNVPKHSFGFLVLPSGNAEAC